MTATEDAHGIERLTADSLYDAVKEFFGQPPCFSVFDKRTLLPLDQLPDLVKAETGKMLARDRVDGGVVAAGRLPPLSVEESGEPGFALYAPSRIGLLLELEGRGYDAGELRALAADEEEYIDNILVNDETPTLTTIASCS